MFCIESSVSAVQYKKIWNINGNSKIPLDILDSPGEVTHRGLRGVGWGGGVGGGGGGVAIHCG